MEALGHLTQSRIFGTEVDRAPLLQRAKRCGFSDFAPAVIQAGDPFPRATHTRERLRVAREDTTFVKSLVQDVRGAERQIVRHLARETDDAAHVRLDYPAVLDLGLDEETAPLGRILSRRAGRRSSISRPMTSGPPSHATRVRIRVRISGSWCSGC